MEETTDLRENGMAWPARYTMWIVLGFSACKKPTAPVPLAESPAVPRETCVFEFDGAHPQAVVFPDLGRAVVEGRAMRVVPRGEVWSTEVEIVPGWVANGTVVALQLWVAPGEPITAGAFEFHPGAVVFGEAARGGSVDATGGFAARARIPCDRLRASEVPLAPDLVGSRIGRQFLVEVFAAPADTAEVLVATMGLGLADVVVLGVEGPWTHIRLAAQGVVVEGYVRTADVDKNAPENHGVDTVLDGGRSGLRPPRTLICEGSGSLVDASGKVLWTGELQSFDPPVVGHAAKLWPDLTVLLEAERRSVPVQLVGVKDLPVFLKTPPPASCVVVDIATSP